MNDDDWEVLCKKIDEAVHLVQTIQKTLEDLTESITQLEKHLLPDSYIWPKDVDRVDRT